jgi:hypothetical protein
MAWQLTQAIVARLVAAARDEEDGLAGGRRGEA